MLTKKAELSIGKDSEGWIIVEEATLLFPLDL